MEDQALAWERELERRIRIYDQLEAGGHWPGRLSAVDYWAMAVLTVALSVGFWMWGH